MRFIAVIAFVLLLAVVAGAAVVAARGAGEVERGRRDVAAAVVVTGVDADAVGDARAPCATAAARSWRSSAWTSRWGTGGSPADLDRAPSLVRCPPASSPSWGRRGAFDSGRAC